MFVWQMAGTGDSVRLTSGIDSCALVHSGQTGHCRAGNQQNHRDHNGDDSQRQP